MTPDERNREQHNREQRQRDREEFRRAQRLDLIPVVVGISVLLVSLIGGGMLLVAIIEGKI